MRRSTSPEVVRRWRRIALPASAWVFVIAFAALALLRRRAFTTPYFWDEVGYYVPNAVSMLRNGLDPIPDLTVPQSYPPLQPLLLVATWTLLGFSIAATRVLGFALAAGVASATFALGRALFSTSVGLAAAALTVLAPVFFGQTGFALPEVPLALFTTLATLALVRERVVHHAFAVAALLMTKWTSLVAVPVFAAYAVATAPSRRAGLARLLAYVPALALLAAWLGYFYLRTGSLTSPSPDYARVNLLANLGPTTLASRFIVRAEQLLTYDAAWLLTAPALAIVVRWALGRIPADARTRASVLLLAGIVAATLAFLTVSGFLLPRYFVPVAPLVAVLGAAAVFRLFPRWLAVAWIVVAAASSHAGWYGLSSSPRLLDGGTAYFDFVDSHVAAARWLEANAPTARVAAPWPVVDELREPFLGYVRQPVATVDLANDPREDAFDLLVEAPAPGVVDVGGEAAAHLGLVRVAEFRVGEQSVTIWAKPERR